MKNSLNIKLHIEYAKATSFKIGLFLAISLATSLLSLNLFAHGSDSPSHDDIDRSNGAKFISTGKAPRVTPPAKEVEKARQYFTDLVMTTHDGKTVKFYSDMLDNKVVLLNVMYTKCKDGCPLITQQLAQVKKQLGDSFGKEVFFVSISNDPVRETPETLRKFALKHKANHPGWTFLTGSRESVKGIISKLGLYSNKVEEHNPLLIAGNTRTRHWVKIVPNTPIPAIAFKLKELVNEG